MESISKANSTITEIDLLDCFEILKKNKQSYLIDVRTQPEWQFVGVPDLTSINKKVIFISWQLYPDMRINNDFETEILSFKIKKVDTIFLICRSGKRSSIAAHHLNQLGYRNCFNVSDGFEGVKDINDHRSTLGGWKLKKLPWKQ